MLVSKFGNFRLLIIEVDMITCSSSNLTMVNESKWLVGHEGKETKGLWISVQMLFMDKEISKFGNLSLLIIVVNIINYS